MVAPKQRQPGRLTQKSWAWTEAASSFSPTGLYSEPAWLWEDRRESIALLKITGRIAIETYSELSLQKKNGALR